MSSTNVATFFNNSDIQPSDIIETKDVLGDVDEDIPPPPPKHSKQQSYGHLIVLGTCYHTGDTVRRAIAKMPQKRYQAFTMSSRAVPNGVARSTVIGADKPDTQAKTFEDTTRHTVSYVDRNKTKTMVVYDRDDSKDMFQIGRSSEPQIDFSIADTILINAANDAHSHKSPRHRSSSDLPKSFSSTISRYACRLLIDRSTGSCRVHAAGFDSRNNIFLGEKATKWARPSGYYDGLTTNGVLILHPPTDSSDRGRSQRKWHEVSVDGDIYTLRRTRASPTRGHRAKGEVNELKDGTLIDLCGATLLYRSPEGLEASPSRDQLDSLLTQLNDSKPQCPVNLMTLVVPKRRAQHKVGQTPPCKANGHAEDRQPYAYLACGHVQGAHRWGHKPVGAAGTMHKCPLCTVQSEHMLSLSMGMEPAFHLNDDVPDHAFNPCGHMGSKVTVEYWSSIRMPHGTHHFYAVCPFCSTLLSHDKPFVRLHFQQDDFADTTL